MSITLSTLKQAYEEAKALYDDQQFTEAHKILERVYKSVILTGDKKFMGDFFALAGDNNFGLGNYQQSLQLYLEAEKIFKDLKLMQELAQAEYNLGAAYRRLGLYAHALFKNLESLTYSFQANEQYVMTSSLMNAALSLFDTGYTEKAFKALDTGLLVCDKNAGDEKYEEIRIAILNNKATFCIAQKKFEESLKLLEQARNIATQYSLDSMLTVLDSNISQSLVKMNRVEEGFRLLQSVIKRKKNVYDDHYVADVVKMGLIYKEHFHDDRKFLEYFEQALELAKNKNLIAREIFISRILKDYYHSQKKAVLAQQFEKSLKTLEEKDSLNKQTGGMENLFDTNVLAIENMLREKEKKPEFLNQYDYLIGTYAYTHRGLTRHLLLREIAFCEVRGNYLYIHTFTKNSSGQMVLEDDHKVRKTMKDFVTEINTSAVFFARIHNSFIVNLYWLSKDSLKGGSSLFIGGKELKISDSYRSAFKEKLNAFFEQELSVR